MSESIRQNNLFSGEDYQKVFKAYSFIDYTAYDFDTLKQALINYIQTYYPEDFNDYIESSEFIAIIELIAYFGTSLAFRTDLNSRENFIDTAERRESIIRLAQMVNYVPRRNIPASGLFKISAVQTDQVLTDANGINLNGLTIYWNDPNNSDWFDQFIQVCNAAFSSLNPFGRPTKSGSIGSIPTDLYELSNIIGLNVTYPTVITINNQQYPVDVCNPDFIPNETIFERDPDPANAFNFLYRNDSLGTASPNTGFFLYFKQGTLLNYDANFEFPVPNRIVPIDIQNINQYDVYVQETTQTGAVVNKWIKVPELAGENIVYNSIQFAERNIFSVVSGPNDTVSIRFADGNFGNVPTGLFRFWVRTSANQALVIRPDNAQGLQITIPYVGADNQSYTLRVIFSLEQTIGNAAATETDEQIKLRAPEVFSTQSRMVNGSDYNVLPLIYGNQIAKIQAIDRTYSGQSRYIDINDPTGFHRDLIIFGQDGGLYRDNQNVLAQVVRDEGNTLNIEAILLNTIQELLRDQKTITFFYDEYIPQFESKIRVNKQLPTDAGYSILDLNNPYQESLYWKTSPTKFKNDTGYFANTTAIDAPGVALTNNFTTLNIAAGTYQPWGFIRTSAVIEMANPSDATTLNSARVNNVVQSGIPLIVNPLNPYANVGPVELGKEEQTNYKATKVYPIFRNELTLVEIQEIVNAINAGISFWLYYNLLIDEWHTSTTAIPGLTDQADSPFSYPPAITDGIDEEIYSNWTPYPDSGLLYVAIASDNQLGTTTYDMTARGRAYVFTSYKDVRFYWEPNQIILDSATGLALQDNIEIMPFVNTNSLINNNEPVIADPTTSFLKAQVAFNISGVYVQDDGYLDSSKVEVSLADNDGDNIADDPDGFNKIVSPIDRIVFEFYTDSISGYQGTRPWVAKWKTELETVPPSPSLPTELFVYFPVNPSDDTALYSSPYVANMELSAAPDILDPGSVVLPGFKYVYMDELNLMFTNNLDQISYNNLDFTASIANQLSAFFNLPINPTAPLITPSTPQAWIDTNTNYPWLIGTEYLSNKTNLINDYFIDKSYLISDISPPGYGVYYTFEFQDNPDILKYPSGKILIEVLDRYHFDKNGKVFTQNTSIPVNDRLPLYFKWEHYSPIDQRVDPSPTNIIDMIVVTDSYYRDVLIWKNSNGSLISLPEPPTTEELRIQFQDLNKYKMVSDSMVWNSGNFKILFGEQAEPELQAIFKVVKAPSSNISDNEVKTRVIQAIDAYFDIRNWDFGERFFYTELAAFIHQQLSRVISSVVIVPSNASSQFGNLFEIISNPNELFISTATVNNVAIVANLTDQNLRV